jgi:hypothetical protein
MSKIMNLASFAIATLALCLMASPIHAQASRTWVSGVGDDANPCSRTTPCKTFAGAISKTATNGEINCLDNGGFGAVTITKSITISCEGVTGGVLASSTNGINVNVTSTGIVYLRGLDIQGFTTGLSGINFIGAGVLHVERCLIRTFNAGAAAGINFAPNGASELYVSDSFITDNGVGSTGAGILIRPTAGGVNAVLNHVHAENKSLGIKVDSTAGPGTVNVTVSDSISAGNTNADMAAFTTPGTGTANVMVNRTSLSASLVGLRSDGPTTTVRIGDSAIFGNVTGVVTANGGMLQSYGNNQLNGNATDGSMGIIPLH